ncbi:MAG TPA: hypothetical protein VFP06_13150 [Acidimicrobiales bacterium]|nr:hypothetical protein [Acidimicrobiales bacterium]
MAARMVAGVPGAADPRVAVAMRVVAVRLAVARMVAGVAVAAGPPGRRATVGGAAALLAAEASAATRSRGARPSASC